MFSFVMLTGVVVVTHSSVATSFVEADTVVVIYVVGVCIGVGVDDVVAICCCYVVDVIVGCIVVVYR